MEAYHKTKALPRIQQDSKPAKRPRTDENRATYNPLVEEFLERETRTCGPAAELATADGPTTFGGLFPGAGAPSQQASRPQGAVKFFEDIATRRPLQQQPSQALVSADWLPPVLPKPGGVAGGASAHVSAAAGEGAAVRVLPAARVLPVCWALKSAVRFSCDAPFTVAQQAAALPARDVVDAQRRFAAGTGVSGLSLPQQYLAALMSYQYPHTPGAAAVPPGGARPGPEAAAARWADWQAALCSLYDALRCGRCDAFYVISPEASKSGVVALFTAAGVGGRRRIHGLLSRSTPGVRSLLMRQLRVGFAAPLLGSTAEQEGLATDGGTRSLLVFEGGLRLAGLMELLLNDSRAMHGDAAGVPTLLAPAPFAGAALRALRCKVLPAQEYVGGAGRQHRLELAGPAPAWVVDRLASVLAASQDGSFTMACDPHPLAAALNWRCAADRAPPSKHAPELPDLPDREAQERGCLGASEAVRWRCPPPGLAGAALRELRCKEGLFIARLAARAAEQPP